MRKELIIRFHTLNPRQGFEYTVYAERIENVYWTLQKRLENHSLSSDERNSIDMHLSNISVVLGKELNIPDVRDAYTFYPKAVLHTDGVDLKQYKLI